MTKINYLLIGFENCEGIKIGAGDIKRFTTYNEEILLEVTDNGNSEYDSDWENNLKSPLQRLTDYRDIVSITAFYDNGTKEEITPEWYYESEWHTPQENIYQINTITDYKNRTVLISKQGYINRRKEQLNNIIKEAQEELDMLSCKILVSDMINL